MGQACSLSHDTVNTKLLETVLRLQRPLFAACCFAPGLGTKYVRFADANTVEFTGSNMTEGEGACFAVLAVSGHKLTKH